MPCPINSDRLSICCPAVSGERQFDAIHCDAEKILGQRFALICLLLGASGCWAMPITTSTVPGGIAASTYGSRTFDGDYIFLMTGGPVNQRASASFGFSWTLNADCQDNGYVMAGATVGGYYSNLVYF